MSSTFYCEFLTLYLENTTQLTPDALAPRVRYVKLYFVSVSLAALLDNHLSFWFEFRGSRFEVCYQFVPRARHVTILHSVEDICRHCFSPCVLV